MRAWFGLGILVLTFGCQLGVLHHLGEHHYDQHVNTAEYDHDHGDHTHSHSDDHDHPDQDHELPLALKHITACCLTARPQVVATKLHLVPANGWRTQGARWVPQQLLSERGHSRAPPLSFVC